MLLTAAKTYNFTGILIHTAMYSAMTGIRLQFYDYFNYLNL